jgi:hypothetical protein
MKYEYQHSCSLVTWSDNTFVYIEFESVPRTQMKCLDEIHLERHFDIVKETVTLNGQNNLDRLCSVIWSTVGVVCPARSSGVDQACLSQYFDSLLVYSLLGCFEMLSLGRSIFHCSSRGQIEELNVLMQLLIDL